MYELRQVTKRYRKGRKEVQALRQVDLEVADGDFLTVQGPTGSGKTTLMLLLGALDRPTSGALFLDGTDLGRLNPGQLTDTRARMLGFVFQNFNLMPTLSAAENVQAALVPLGTAPQEARRRARAALEDVGLAERGDFFPLELSGGEQQRVAIARALVKQPRVLLADEPTGNLDEGTRDEVIAILEGLRSSRGLTLVVATHDSQVARRAPRTAVIEAGALTIRVNPPASGELRA